MTPKSDPFDDLPRTPASDLKRLGWRGVMESVAREGQVLVTNHGRPEAVILGITEYARMHEAAEAASARRADALEALRRRFDERLAALQAPDAAERLQQMMDTPLALDGKVKAGTGY